MTAAEARKRTDLSILKSERDKKLNKIFLGSFIECDVCKDIFESDDDNRLLCDKCIIDYREQKINDILNDNGRI